MSKDENGLPIKPKINRGAGFKKEIRNLAEIKESIIRREETKVFDTSKVVEGDTILNPSNHKTDETKKELNSNKLLLLKRSNKKHSREIKEPNNEQHVLTKPQNMNLSSERAGVIGKNETEEHKEPIAQLVSILPHTEVKKSKDGESNTIITPKAYYGVPNGFPCGLLSYYNTLSYLKASWTAGARIPSTSVFKPKIL
jgi:hypothetical protein